MPVEDEDFPLSYLFYILAVIAVMGGIVIGASILLLR